METPISEGYVSATALMGYLFYGHGHLGEEELHRWLLGGDFGASYNTNGPSWDPTAFTACHVFSSLVCYGNSSVKSTRILTFPAIAPL